MEHSPNLLLQYEDDEVTASRMWMAALDELNAMPATALADAQSRLAHPQDTHPRGNPGADEDQLRIGLEKLSAVLG
jgi:hypothetical protein